MMYHEHYEGFLAGSMKLCPGVYLRSKDGFSAEKESIYVLRKHGIYLADDI